MIQVGDYNKLKVNRKTKIGYYLDAGTGDLNDDILLPFKECLEKEFEADDEIIVFIYRDSKDRLVATLREPLAKVGDVAYLKVKENTQIGTFLDMGIDRDLFVPLKEHKYRLNEEKSYLFYVYEDKTGRLAATVDVEEHLEIAEGYKIGDEVIGTICGLYRSENLLIAIEDKYKGIMLKNEYFISVNNGDKIKLKVKRIYEDGTLGVTTRVTGKEERTQLQEEILKYLEANGGFMPFNDNSTPEDIKETFKASKNYFKRALGGLMKKGLITQDENGTKLIK
ncbi:S1-like domain-containing RNA-binding protein [uncultured Clostridium sp.]|uniref:CvfB family protein n=1 Tax=uncultured Clostridium sp. TaxID=59620 RepID=UPI0028E5E272|nr:S1-like domain-containing RNA-binding protein [uncultured Clostridium sp.]